MHEEYNVDLTGQMPQIVPKRKQYAKQQSLSVEILVWFFNILVEMIRAVCLYLSVSERFI